MQDTPSASCKVPSPRAPVLLKRITLDPDTTVCVVCASRRNLFPDGAGPFRAMEHGNAEHSGSCWDRHDLYCRGIRGKELSNR